MGAAALPEMERAFAAARSAPRRGGCSWTSPAGSRTRRPPAPARALDDESPAVRAEAAIALGDGGFREALRPLLERKASDPSPEVRQAAASALRKLQPR